MAHHERSAQGRPAVVALHAGLGLAVVALIVPYVDHVTANVLAAHIRDGYSAYTQARIDSAVTTYLVLPGLLVTDTSGATGLPPSLGWAGMLPCLAGLVAVTLLWKRSR